MMKYLSSSNISQEGDKPSFVPVPSFNGLLSYLASPITEIDLRGSTARVITDNSMSVDSVSYAQATS